MKGRLSSTVWMLVGVTFVALALAFYTGFAAGAHSPGLSFIDGFSGPGGFKMLLGCLLVVLGAGFALYMLDVKVVRPVNELTDFSEKLGAGEYRARVQLDSADDFGYIAENLNRAADKVSRTVFNQEAQDSLQKSVTEFLTITSQIARGDLTLRGKVTNDALGNVGFRQLHAR